MNDSNKTKKMYPTLKHDDGSNNFAFDKNVFKLSCRLHNISVMLFDSKMNPRSTKNLEKLRWPSGKSVCLSSLHSVLIPIRVKLM